MRDILDFDKHDWDHMHDCIVNVTGKPSTREQLIEIFHTLPDDLREEALEWGMSDTCWRDNFITYYESL